MPRPQIDEEVIQEVDDIMAEILEVPPETVGLNTKLEILLEKYSDLESRAISKDKVPEPWEMNR